MGLFGMLFGGAAKRVDGVEAKKIINRDPRDYTEDGLRDKLERLFFEEYRDLEMRREVSTEEFDAFSDARRYSYVWYREGRPVLFILIINKNNDYRKADVVASHEIAKKNGAVCLNFMSYMDNNPEYIRRRIAENIG